MEINIQDIKTPEYTVSQFFECWKEKNKDIKDYIQKTYLTSYINRSRIKEMLDNIDLIGYYLYDKDVITDCRHEVYFRAEIKKGKKTINMYGKANVICETEPLTPSVSGDWGVNPASILLRWQKGK